MAPTPPPARVLTRRRSTLAAGALLIGGLVAASALPTSADEPIQAPYACTLSGNALPELNIPLTLTDTPDPVDPLGILTAELATGLPAIAGVDPATVAISQIQVVIPLPASGLGPITTLELVGGSGWNTGTSTVVQNGTNLDVTINVNPGITLATLQPPSVRIVAPVADAANTVINWLSPTSIITTITAPLQGSVNCAPVDPSRIVGVTGIGAVAPTTAPPTTPTPTTPPPLPATPTTVRVVPPAVNPRFAG